jgi:hypothetical protein
MKVTVFSLATLLAILLLTGIVLGQIATPNANINVIGLIPIPGWAPATGGSFDLATFNPVNRLMYFADGTNHAITTVDTVSNTFVSSIPLGCNTTGCPSGVQVAPDLQKLFVTSRATTDWIYDLKTPGAPPVTLTVPSGSDELDYDPIHQRIYVANTNAPYFLTAIDLAGPNANTITAQIALPGNPEQPRFNPVDGLIYMAIPSFGIVVVDPNGGPTGAGGIMANLTGGGSGSIPSLAQCGPQGNDIDPVTNTMLIGCRGSLNGEASFNLTTQQMLSFQPYPTSNDVLKFNPNTRRWYTGTGGNLNNGGNCPSTNTGTVWPAMGVFAAPAAGSSGMAATFVGTTCVGRGGQRALVDTIGNNIYMNMTQYPVDATSATTGQSGILALNDPAPTQPVLAASQAALGSNGTATFAQDGLQMNAFASLAGLTDAATRLIVTTTVGNETVPCSEAAGKATCSGNLIGSPVVGGIVDLANNGKILVQGKIAQTAPLLATDLTLSTSTTIVGSTYVATVAGSNLGAQTYVDIRVNPPGSSAPIVANNWQTGASAPHSVVTGTPSGMWTITGVRVHQDPNNHTGSFVTVSAPLTVM